MLQRIFVRKKSFFRDSISIVKILKAQLDLPNLLSIETLCLYDLHFPDGSTTGIPDEVISRIFADPVTDDVLENLPETDFSFVIEPLPGQFDQRADSAEQCLALVAAEYADISVRSAICYLVAGNLTEEQQERLKNYFLNPIETRQKDLSETELPLVLPPAQVRVLEGFLSLSDEQIPLFLQTENLAMSERDLALVRDYFQKIRRNPTETELRVLDTYWSDHCRHSTFSTVLQSIIFPDTEYGAAMQADLVDILGKRQTIYGKEAETRPLTLMDIATVDAKYLHKIGNLDDVEFSEEVNACSVKVMVSDGASEKPWLLQFKNETHNHPTEIEPFGGAATCIGGAIRDPLAGRAFVYQALRISGSADPRQNISETLSGKLPQRVIAEKSAMGNSSYGNQIGLATGQVVEFYHQGYQAKHLECGAVVGAVPMEQVCREEPAAGDLVLLIGGATGRDGVGGATGSSRSQSQNSLTQSAAEVQKGNAPEERKLQRLFRNPNFSKKVKRCNDFGAGGVAVAVGELARGLLINLDAVPLKYQGLSATEIAISESQERMAVVIKRADLDEMIALAAAENLTAVAIAEVTKDEKLVMLSAGKKVVEIDRAFLDTNGAKNYQAEVRIDNPQTQAAGEKNLWIDELRDRISNLEYADQRGLGDRFDYSVGAGCVLKPYGGKNNATPSEASVYALPTEENPCQQASILAYGFNPNIAANNPYLAGVLAVTEAAARYVASGGDIAKIRFSLQEYFPKLGSDPRRWGLPTAALLGAHYALSKLNTAAIGGKDSMSGSFERLDVPPTLIAFAVGLVNIANVVSAEFKAANQQVYLLRTPKDKFGRPDFQEFLNNAKFIERATADGVLRSIRSVKNGGLIQALYECSIGNRIGCLIEFLPKEFDPLADDYGSFLISADAGLGVNANLIHIGHTISDASLQIAGISADVNELRKIHMETLSSVYPLHPPYNAADEEATKQVKAQTLPNLRPITVKTSEVRVCVPVFPGTNSELDTARAFRLAGGKIEEAVICNRNREDIAASLTNFAEKIRNSQILVFSGGFSAGDEPDGSGKFIANVLFNSQISDAISDFLNKDGLILGICNGFQALIKSGLLPYGEIKTPPENAPTLTNNTIRRHISRICATVVANNSSPWLTAFKQGDIHDLAFSHGEGRFVAPPETIKELITNGQIATQYADPERGNPSMQPIHNPNGSFLAVEGITDSTGRIFGKMGHSERYRPGLYKNQPNFRPQDIFSPVIRLFY